MHDSRLDTGTKGLNRLCVFAVALVAAGAVSSMPTRGIKYFTVFAAFFSAAVGITVTILLPVVAVTHQTPDFVFTTFQGDNHPNTGIDTGSPNDL